MSACEGQTVNFHDECIKINNHIQANIGKNHNIL